MIQKHRDRHPERQPKTQGEKHWNTKFTEAQVLEIISRKSEPHNLLAAEFGVNRQYISQIVCGRKWGYLTAKGSQQNYLPKGKYHGNTK
jgi:hypothetical protein